MATTDLKDLLKTVETLRKQLHPDLDPKFLEAVIRAEGENPEDDTEALQSIERALKGVLRSKGSR